MSPTRDHGQIEVSDIDRRDRQRLQRQRIDAQRVGRRQRGDPRDEDLVFLGRQVALRPNPVAPHGGGAHQRGDRRRDNPHRHGRRRQRRACGLRPRPRGFVIPWEDERDRRHHDRGGGTWQRDPPPGNRRACRQPGVDAGGKPRIGWHGGHRGRHAVDGFVHRFPHHRRPPNPSRSSFPRSTRRASAIRHFTVPSGIASIVAMSS